MTANSTVTSICNRALGAVGTRTTITSINDGSNEANICALYYDTTRQELLRAALWNCARKSLPLTLYKAQPGTPENPTSGTVTWVPATQPIPPWIYEYYNPPDCLRMQMILPQINTTLTGTTPLFSVASGVAVINPYPGAVGFKMAYDTDSQGNPIEVILTNQSQAIGTYTLDQQATNIFDSQFEAALVAALAAYICIPLNGSLQMRQMNAMDAKERVLNARITDGNEGPETQNRTAEWIIARGMYPDYYGTTTVNLGFLNPGFFAWA